MVNFHQEVHQNDFKYLNETELITLPKDDNINTWPFIYIQHDM